MSSVYQVIHFWTRNLLTLKLCWHDRIDHGDWEKKRDCLSALVRLPETVKYAVFMEAESVQLDLPLAVR